MLDRILIVGLGSIGKRHLRIARDLLPDADIRVMRHQLCDEIPQLANGCFDNLHEACVFSPQVAVIASPAPFHIDTAVALAKINCHLLIEKPISHNAENIGTLIELGEQHELVIQVGYNLRFHQALVQFRKLIYSGQIGRVLSVRSEVGQYLPLWRPETDYRYGVSARSELGGGVLLELSHELDYLRWIFGEISTVSAWLGKQSDLEVDVEDSVYLTLEFVSHTISPGAVASVCIDFIRHDTTRTCVAIGDQGSLRWNGVSSEIDYWKAGAVEWELLFQYEHQLDDTYRSEWEHFLHCIRNQEKPLVTAEDGLAIMKVIDTVRASNDAMGERLIIGDRVKDW